jgi:predicted metal-dependent hydrolase
VPDELHMSVDDTVALAQTYLDSGRPFHAHEVLEALWKTQPKGERDLWQGLAQIAVGLTHAMRGNTVGATTLLRRGAGRVANYSGDSHGIDIVGVLRWAEALADAPSAEPQPPTLVAASG